LPYFELNKGEVGFPPAHFADLDGLLAVGGDMTTSQLVRGYQSGVFYWHHPMKHVKWWSPDPRLVLETESFHANALNSEFVFTTSVNTRFEELLRLFQHIYNDKEAMGPSWLSERMFRIFMELFEEGRVHAQEVFCKGSLVGGFLGVCVGNMCFGEYTAGTLTGAADFAIASGVAALRQKGIQWIDMQKETSRVDSLEYSEISRLSFVDYCRRAGEGDKETNKTSTL
jgi:leucyl/phenylalanyl-tRNA--protein transferase